MNHNYLRVNYSGIWCNLRHDILDTFFIYDIHNNYIINNKSDKIKILKI
jgi:hypothetical protein